MHPSHISGAIQDYGSVARRRGRRAAQQPRLALAFLRAAPARRPLNSGRLSCRHWLNSGDPYLARCNSDPARPQELMALPEVEEAGLRVEEVIVLYLYTGPMFQASPQPLPSHRQTPARIQPQSEFLTSTCNSL